MRDCLRQHEHHPAAFRDNAGNGRGFIGRAFRPDQQRATIVYAPSLVQVDHDRHDPIFRAFETIEMAIIEAPFRIDGVAVLTKS